MPAQVLYMSLKIKIKGKREKRNNVIFKTADFDTKQGIAGLKHNKNGLKIKGKSKYLIDK